MRRELIAAFLATLLGCNPVFAQVAGIGSPMPGMGVTSPFGMGSAAGSVGPSRSAARRNRAGDARTEPGTAQHIGIGIHGLLDRGRCAHCYSDRNIRWRWPRHCYRHVADGNGHDEHRFGEHM